VNDEQEILDNDEIEEFVIELDGPTIGEELRDQWKASVARGETSSDWESWLIERIWTLEAEKRLLQLDRSGHVHRFTVRGYAPFPIEMLVEEELYPLPDHGAYHIQAPKGSDNLYYVGLGRRCNEGDDCWWSPSREGWHSHGWQVIREELTGSDE
jgi:hypothetical protein